MNQDKDFSIQNEIDELATRVFKDSLPPNWHVVPQIPDQNHADYMVEIREANALTGLTFYVQQKGKKRLKIRNGLVNFSGLETKHLRYWAEKSRRPVFLVVINATTKEGYWLFLQEYIDGHADSAKLEHHKQLTVRLPLSQTLRNIEAFKEAAANAEKYLMGKNSLPVIFEEKRRILEKLDPRFEAAINFIDGVTSIELRAREVVRFTMRFTGSSDRVREFHSEFFEKGSLFMLNPGELSVKGSPLLEKAFGAAGAIKGSRTISIDVRVIARDAQGRESAHIDLHPATIEGGAAEFRLCASRPNAPLSVTGIGRIGGMGKLSISVNFSRWKNQQLLNLAFFEQIYGIFKSVEAQESVCVEITYLGQLIAISGFDSASAIQFKPLIDAIKAIAMAREIAKCYGLNVLFPEKIAVQELQMIEEEHAFLILGSRPYPAQLVTTTIQPSRLSALAKETPGGLKNGTLRLERPAIRAPFFGQDVSFPAVVLELSKVAVEIPQDCLDAIPCDPDGFAEIPWKTGPDSILTVKAA